MSLTALDNLARIGQLKAEARNDAECRRLLAMARTHLADSNLAGASREGRFLSAYNAGHAAALAVLRHPRYRSETRFTVFQCLAHTLNWPAPRWRILDSAHQKRNIAEYEGLLEVEESTIAELHALVTQLIAEVATLTTSTPTAPPQSSPPSNPPPR